MKKTLKALLIAVAMVAILLLLTGCGNKLVATKTTDEMGMKFEEKMEISFKGDKANSVKMTYTFADKETAESMKAILNLGLSATDSGLKVEQKGKKVIMKIDAKTFAEMSDSETDADSLTKAKVKEQLEEQGYKVK